MCIKNTQENTNQIKKRTMDNITDNIDKFLLDECCIIPGACSSVESVKYLVAKEVAEKMQQQMIVKACEWLEVMACYYAHWEYNGDTYEKEIVYDTEKLIEDFKKAMEEQL